MQAHAKKHPTDVEIQFLSKKHPRLFVVSKEKAKGLIELLSDYEVETKSDDFIPMADVFPELLDDAKRPAIALRGSRRKEGLSQTSLAKKLGVEQGDISKMERGERPIGKKMAARLAKVLNVDYRIFL